MASQTQSQEQKALAAALGVDVSGDSYDIAAAKLLDAVATAIGFEPPAASSDRQRAFALSLGHNVVGDSKRLASAKIGEALLAKNREVIAALDLKPGDRVVRTEHFEFEGEMRSISQEFIVSSIQPNGRVFFKGGNGQGAWPTQLTKRAG
jgi:hypothetical protein